MSVNTPLKPLSENTNSFSPNSSRPTNQSKISSSPVFSKMSKTPTSPLKTPYSAGMSKLSQSSAASSPFFSSPPGRGESPSKMSDFELIGVDDDDLGGFFSGKDDGGCNGDGGVEVGDDTVCSNFSDVTIGQYGAGKAEKVAQESSVRKRSPTLTKLSQDASPTAHRESTSHKKPRLQSRPQTPTRSPVATPHTNNTSRLSPKGSNPFSPKELPSATPQTTTHPAQTPNLLLDDFTVQFSAIAGRPSNPETPIHRRARSASPNKPASPAKLPLPPSTPAESRFFNLLDFSPGPLATPRSIPSITPREVENLKGSFNSQIAQLRAELSGREVEISGLRTAVAESESCRAEMTHTMKEAEARIEEERENWRSIRAELGQLFEAEKVEKETLKNEAEKRENEVRKLRERAEEAVRELADAELRINQAEEEAANAREEALKAKEAAASSVGGAQTGSPTTGNVQTEVEKVARELHALYKAKHESKVSALKKSYESRWEKKVGQLTADLEAEKRKNEELVTQITEKGADDMTNEFKFTSTHPATSSAEQELKDELTKLKTELSIIQNELDTERREKGELVGAVEELLAIQAGPSSGGEQAAAETENVKKRVARVSGVGLPAGSPVNGFQGGLKSGIARMGGGGAKNKVSGEYVE